MTPNLTIELVPKSCWFKNVRSIVTPEEWSIIKKQVYQRARYRCEICGERGPEWPVECHEIFEYDDELHIQKLNGLTALCPACHEVKHIGLATNRGRASEATDHLAVVNNWTLPEAESYVEACFEVWAERSTHVWELDVSNLMKNGSVQKSVENV